MWVIRTFFATKETEDQVKQHTDYKVYFKKSTAMIEYLYQSYLMDYVFKYDRPLTTWIDGEEYYRTCVNMSKLSIRDLIKALIKKKEIERAEES